MTCKLSLVLVSAVLVYLAPVKAYMPLCPESENPLNILFNAPYETLSDKTTVETHPIGLEFFDPRDVGCKTNYDDIKIEQFEKSVDCEMVGQDKVNCHIKQECIDARKAYFQRVKKVVLRALDEVVLKIIGIRYYERSLGAKQLIFGKQPLSQLSGVEIVKKSTSGKFNTLKGFQVANESDPVYYDAFDNMFNTAVELYVELRNSGEPTGEMATKECINTSQMFFHQKTESRNCAQKFFEAWKDKTKLAPVDSKLVDLIEETVNLAKSYFSLGKLRFDKLKIPFMGPCIGGEDLDPNSAYVRLSQTIQALKRLD